MASRLLEDGLPVANPKVSQAIATSSESLEKISKRQAKFEDLPVSKRTKVTRFDMPVNPDVHLEEYAIIGQLVNPISKTCSQSFSAFDGLILPEDITSQQLFERHWNPVGLSKVTKSDHSIDQGLTASYQYGSVAGANLSRKDVWFGERLRIEVPKIFEPSQLIQYKETLRRARKVQNVPAYWAPLGCNTIGDYVEKVTALLSLKDEDNFITAYSSFANCSSEYLEAGKTYMASFTISVVIQALVFLIVKANVVKLKTPLDTNASKIMQERDIVNEFEKITPGKKKANNEYFKNLYTVLFEASSSSNTEQKAFNNSIVDTTQLPKKNKQYLKLNNLAKAMLKTVLEQKSTTRFLAKPYKTTCIMDLLTKKPESLDKMSSNFALMFAQYMSKTQGLCCSDTPNMPGAKIDIMYRRV